MLKIEFADRDANLCIGSKLAYSECAARSDEKRSPVPYCVFHDMTIVI